MPSPGSTYETCLGRLALSHVQKAVLGDGGLQNYQVLEMKEPSEITYSNHPLLPMGTLRPRKDGDVARVTKAELRPGTCSQCLHLAMPPSLASPAFLLLLGPPLWILPLSTWGAASTSRILLQFRGLRAHLPFDLSSDMGPGGGCTLNTACPFSSHCCLAGGG